MKQTAEQRAMEMMRIPMNQLPVLAQEYLRHISKVYGFCGEVCITAYAHYAQAVENLKCKDKAYKIDKQGKLWFKEMAK